MEGQRMIKFVVFDFDGVFTDGRFYFGPNDFYSKSYYVRDKHALTMLKEQNVLTGIITVDPYVSVKCAPPIYERMDKVEIGCKRPKEEVLKEWIEELGLDSSEVAYMGDDLPDVGCLKLVGLPACPADATDAARAVSKFVSNKNGGNGAVREFVEHLIAVDFYGQAVV
jgi:3-deoxy-D-manno-octulosonate 8-phosphate phosphatase (KDO 8-P phosphatase)